MLSTDNLTQPRKRPLQRATAPQNWSGAHMAIRISVWITILLIVLIVTMAGFARLAPIGSDLQQFGQSFFDWLDRVTPGEP